MSWAPEGSLAVFLFVTKWQWNWPPWLIVRANLCAGRAPAISGGPRVVGFDCKFTENRAKISGQTAFSFSVSGGSRGSDSAGKPGKTGPKISGQVAFQVPR